MIQISIDDEKETYIDTIKNNKKEKIIIFDCDDPITLYPYDPSCPKNHFNNWFYEIFTKLDEEYYENVHFLTGDVNVAYNYQLVKDACIKKNIIRSDRQDIHLHCYPWMFTLTAFDQAGHHWPKESNENIKLKYNVCFLSLGRKLARMLVIKELHKYKNFVYSNLGYFSNEINEDTIVNLGELEPIDNFNYYAKDHKFFLNCDSILTNHYIKDLNFKSYKRKLLTEDINLYKDILGLKSNYDLINDDTYTGHWETIAYLAPREYFESAISLFCETSLTTSSVITEKTFKNYMSKKVSIGFAGPHYYEYLKKHGYELYDDLFDYSFDSYSCHERFDYLIYQIKDILNMELSYIEEIINDNKVRDKLNHNFERSIETRNMTSKYFDSHKIIRPSTCEMIVNHDEFFNPPKFNV